MNINKALEHLNWKLLNHWKPTKKDIEAYNSIIDWKEQIESKTLYENDNFAKLWIYQFLSFAYATGEPSEAVIDHLDTILKRSVHSWCVTLKDNLNALKTLQIDENRDDYNQEYVKQLTMEIKEDDVIKFVERMINRSINIPI